MKNALGLLAVTSLLLLAACDEHFSKDSYFGGAVIAEYQQYGATGQDDYLTLKFYEKGSYKVSFSITPGESGKCQSCLPKNFTRTIEQGPQEVLIKQYQLPDFLRITITKDGQTETKDFR